jgi:hypothetical protein
VEGEHTLTQEKPLRALNKKKHEHWNVIKIDSKLKRRNWFLHKTWFLDNYLWLNYYPRTNKKWG